MKLYKKVAMLCVLFWAGFVVAMDNSQTEQNQALEPETIRLLSTLHTVGATKPKVYTREQELALRSEIITQLKKFKDPAILKVAVDISKKEMFGEVTKDRVAKITTYIARKHPHFPSYYMTKNSIRFEKNVDDSSSSSSASDKRNVYQHSCDDDDCDGNCDRQSK